MLFNSFEFIFLFLPCVLVGYFLIPSHKAKLIWLLIASYVFYGYWNYKFIPLLLFSTSVDFYLGLAMHRTQNELKRRRLLMISLITNLGVLGFFKYFMFFTDNFFALTSMVSSEWSRNFYLDIVLPVGISFYTFQSMSYTIDLYYQKTQPHRDFFAFAAYVALFPQLVAGPIIRHSELVYQLEDPKRGKFNYEQFAKGLILFTLGLAKKIIFADRLAAAIDPALVDVSQLSTLEAWLSTLGYTLQLYFDFSGYSDMAIGLGAMLGFTFPINFNSPYKSKSITEFWQRWHISLSSWLRDYLYIPLGGNRGSVAKTYRNLFLTMLLGGLWHGANWVYVIWGAYHGLLLGLERALRGSKLNRQNMVGYKLTAYNTAKHILTFLLIMVGWVIFRSTDVSMATTWLGKMWLPPYDFSMFNFEPKVRDKFLPVLIIGLWAVFKLKNTAEYNLDIMITKYRYAILFAILFFICLSFFDRYSPFLYFQF